MNGSTQNITNAVDNLINQIVESHGLAGIAVGIVKESKTIYARGFGVRDINTQEPVTKSSLFPIASVTKTFTATAVMQRIEQYDIQIDTPFVEYLPYFQLEDERYRQITIRQLLTHTGGLPRGENYWDEPDFQPEVDDDALERHLRSLAGARLIHTPGEKFAYSNLDFEILGDVIAKVSGQSFESYMAEHILQPLDMHQSTFFKPDVDSPLATTPHVHAPQPMVSPVYPYHRAHAPQSCLHSNVTEMCNWMTAHLNRGTFQNRQLLNGTTYDLCWHPYVLVNDGEPPTYMGLSWFIGEHRGHRTVSHPGDEIGFRAVIILLPKQELGVVVLVNSGPVPETAFAKAVVDIALGLQPEPPKPLVIVPVSQTLAEKGLDASIAHYRELEKNHPDEYDFDWSQYYTIGWNNLLVSLKKPKEAVEIFKLAVAIYPESDAYYHVLGEVSVQSGDIDLAIESLQKCLELNPAHPHAGDILQELVDKE
ncbi:class A beta-lactamase-related serine hydrolase [Chloroflexi bacterium TSY]|nr:class A beta-lactamase-related serine hydrolase [Chloroflexi bacterium TSY]